MFDGLQVSNDTAIGILMLALAGVYVGAFLLLLIPSFRKWRKRRKAKREETMGKEREVADAIVTMMEDLEYAGYITRRQKVYWYKQLHKAVPVMEFAPRNYTVLKRRIRLRLLNGGPKPKLPDAIPESELAMLLKL